MFHKMWQRPLGRFVMKNELATRSSPLPLTLLPHYPQTRLTEMRAYSGNESSQHTKFRVSATPTTTTTETVMSLMWFNKRNKVKTEKEKNQNLKPFARKVKLKLGGTCLCTSTIHLKIERTIKTKRRWNEGGRGSGRENRGLVIAQFSLYLYFCCCFSFGRLPDHTT